MEYACIRRWCLVQAVSDSNIPLECCYSYGQTRYKPEFSKISNFLTRSSSWSGFLISRFWQRKEKKIYLTGVFVAGIFLVNNSSRNFVLLRNNLAIYTYSKEGGGGGTGRIWKIVIFLDCRELFFSVSYRCHFSSDYNYLIFVPVFTNAHKHLQNLLTNILRVLCETFVDVCTRIISNQSENVYESYRIFNVIINFARIIQIFAQLIIHRINDINI